MHPSRCFIHCGAAYNYQLSSSTTCFSHHYYWAGWIPIPLARLIGGVKVGVCMPGKPPHKPLLLLSFSAPTFVGCTHCANRAGFLNRIELLLLISGKIRGCIDAFLFGSGLARGDHHWASDSIIHSAMAHINFDRASRDYRLPPPPHTQIIFRHSYGHLPWCIASSGCATFDRL